MKFLIATALLASLSFSSCANHSDDPGPDTSTPAPPVVVMAFTPTAGGFTIQPTGSAAYSLRGLQLQIVSQANTDKTVTYSYTWHGLTPAGTGIEVLASTTVANTTKPELNSLGVYVKVLTYSTQPDFTNPQPLDLAGSGILKFATNSYTLAYTAQFLNGTLNP